MATDFGAPGGVGPRLAQTVLLGDARSVAAVARASNLGNASQGYVHATREKVG